MIAVLAHLGSATAAEWPADRVVLVLLRSLAYDSALAEGAGTELQVDVVHSRSARASRVEAALTQLVGTRVGNVPLVAPLESGPDAPLPESVDVVVLVDVDDPTAVVTIARERHVRVLSVDSRWVGAGAMLGVELGESSLRLIVDRAEAERQGARLSAELLQLATTVDGR